VEELSYWFGHGAMDPNRDRGDRPMPEKRLLFLIDGEVGIRTGMDKEWLSYYVDYFVLQAYGGMADYRMTGVLRDMDDWIQQGIITPDEIVRRTIATENFESYANTGGGFLGMSNYVYKNTYTVNGKPYEIDQLIGGCGLYRVGFDYAQGKGDYDGSPEYYFLRQGITNIYRNFYDRMNAANEE
ncbi:MAG: endoglycosidase, partial [Bacteroides xylanisolvens]